MQITTTALLICLAAISQAVSIQRDASPNSARSLPGVSISCTNQNIETHSDMDNAASQLTSWCNGGGNVKSGEYKSFTSGTAMAYICADSSSNGETCNSGDWNSAVTDWNAQCGAYTGASVYIKQWKLTYGQGLAGEGVCGSDTEQTS